MAQNMSTRMSMASPWQDVMAMVKRVNEPIAGPISVGMPSQVPQITNMPREVDASNLKLASLSIPVGGSSQTDKEYEALIKQDIEQRRGGVEGMQKQIEALQKKQYGLADIDLSNTMQFANSLRGTNSTYTAPTQMAKDQETIKKLEEAILKEKGAITDDMVQILKNSSDKEYQKAMIQMGRDRRFDESQLRHKEDRMMKDLNKDLEDIAEVEKQWSTLSSALASGDSQKINNALAVYARSISGERGVLTDRDIVRVMPSNLYMDLARMSSYFSTTPSAEVPPEMTKKMVEMIQQAQQIVGQVYKDRINQKRQMYSSALTYAPLMQQGGSGDMMFKVAEQKIGGLVGEPNGGRATPASGGVVSPQDWLNQRRAKK